MDYLSYTPFKQMDSSGKCLHTELWTSVWQWKMLATFLVLSERLFLVRCSFCLCELEYQIVHAREIMSERSWQRDHIRKIMRERERKRKRIREIMSETLCKREPVHEIVSKKSSWRDNLRGIQSERSCMRDHFRVIGSERSCQRACPRACHSVSELYCWRERFRQCVPDGVSVTLCQSGEHINSVISRADWICQDFRSSLLITNTSQELLPYGSTVCTCYTRPGQNYALYAEQRQNNLAGLGQYRQPPSTEENFNSYKQVNTNGSFTKMRKHTRYSHRQVRVF